MFILYVIVQHTSKETGNGVTNNSLDTGEDFGLSVIKLDSKPEDGKPSSNNNNNSSSHNQSNSTSNHGNHKGTVKRHVSFLIE